MDETRHQLALCTLLPHFVCLHIWVIHLDVGPLDVLQTEKLVADFELRRRHRLEAEVRLQLRLVEVVRGLLHLLRVVSPVPRLDCKVRFLHTLEVLLLCS